MSRIHGPYDREPGDECVQAGFPAPLPHLAVAAQAAGPAHQMLTRALAEAGVELGACDERVLDWLGRAAQPGAVLSIAGWIERPGQRRR